MADVAEAAGVSHQTVSRVLNAHPHVALGTRDRVLHAISELGYRRNAHARALVTRRAQTIGVVTRDTTLYGPSSTLLAVELAARAAGYRVSIASARLREVDSVTEAVDELTAAGVDGLVVVAVGDALPTPVGGLGGRTPVVVIGAEVGGKASVRVDQVAGGRLATEHLLGLGHRAVHLVTGPLDTLDAVGRLDGWRATLEAAGVPVTEPVSGDWSPRSGYAAGQRLVGRRGLDAVFVSNDQMALGLLRCLDEYGLRVPDDVSVVGYDDIPEAEFFTPPLTTVRQPFTDVGKRAIAALLAALGGRATEPVVSVVDPTLVVRASTAPYGG
jgi:DNA-binding LacI/PurR family transcriptional regulator